MGQFRHLVVPGSPYMPDTSRLCSALLNSSLNFILFQSLQLLASGLPFFKVRRNFMSYWKVLALPTLIAALLSVPRSGPAQVSVNIGAEPACPYGYYDNAPYDCAPYGYYGPQWFNG